MHHGWTKLKTDGRDQPTYWHHCKLSSSISMPT
jgi:hypothetical protein